jgi:ribosomal protein L29
VKNEEGLKTVATVEELKAKQADLRAAVSSQHVPKNKLQNDIQTKRAQIREFDRAFASAKVTGDQEAAAGLKMKSGHLADELADLEKILQAYEDGTLSTASAAAAAIVALGRELYHDAAETGQFFQAEHGRKLQAALELKKAYLAAIKEIGNACRSALQCSVIIRDTRCYVSIAVSPASLRPNSITNFAETLLIKKEDVFESYGPEGEWYQK